MLALIYAPTTPGVAPTFNIVAMLVEACLVVAPVCVCAVLFRRLYEWGNKGRKLKLKRERKVGILSGFLAFTSDASSHRYGL